MAILGILVGFPLLTAFAMLFIRHDAARDRVVKVAAAITAILSVVVSVMYFKTMPTFFNIGSEVFSTVLLIAEIAMCVLIVYLCLRARRWFTALLSVAQTALIVWFELEARAPRLRGLRPDDRQARHSDDIDHRSGRKRDHGVRARLHEGFSAPRQIADG
ncbi:hypothetical protein RWV98_08280 [Agathobaculum sp. NTUH-O15-33]|uniref:hypothetical protein n=1 Tax=Agathobaculum sp. NTUH-O15-33 TaxID=3079302 RepID=UPI0029587B7A|nr:hypothetical protein [Agathobaculum sp. NTUH-O15-33]WNX86252.1 hypothetical protein RWV98_08280 [Agathobaculum sp. NTUH-O15-33]